MRLIEPESIPFQNKTKTDEREKTNIHSHNVTKW